MAMIEMNVSDWIQVPDNPRQRNTEKRAKIALKRHLAKYQKPHGVVFAATKNGTIICKLDGHTRALLWSIGELECPPNGKVEVVLFEVSGLREAKELYDMLDGSGPVKKPSDGIYGSCRELGFRLDSYLLRNCAFTTQLKIATTGKKFSGDINAMIKDWKNELIALDSLDLTSQNTILIAVMLTAIRRDGIEKAGEYFKLLDAHEGQKSNKGYDGVMLLSWVLAIRRAEGRTAGYDNLINICGQAWNAYNIWLSGEIKKTATLPIGDFTQVVCDLNATKQKGN